MKKAMQRLIRGPDGRMKVTYVDLETLQPITDLTGYEVINSGSSYVEEETEETETPQEETPQQEQPRGRTGGGYPYLSEIRYTNPEFSTYRGPGRFPAAPKPVPTAPQQVQPVQNPVTPGFAKQPEPQTPPAQTPTVPSGPGMGTLVSNPNPSVSFRDPKQSGIATPLSDALQGTSREFGRDMNVTSGYRSPEHNRAVGGAPKSYHTKGLAADIDMSGMTEQERQSLVQELSQRGAGGFITYTSMPDTLHVDMRPRDPLASPHFMHDRTATQMGKAPGWFQDIATAGGTMLPASGPIPPSNPRTANPMMSAVNQNPMGFAPEKEKSVAQQAIDNLLTNSVAPTPTESPKSSYSGYASRENVPQNDDITFAQAGALGYGFNDMSPQDISDIATVIAGELSPSARASIASGQPTEEAVEAMGGILSSMTNRAGARDWTLRDVAYQPNQFSAVNPNYIDATREMYNPVSQQMDQAVKDYFSGQYASQYGLGTAVPNPTATNYYADYVSPAWSNSLLGVTRDTTGHVFGNLPEFGNLNVSGTSFADQIGKDRRGYEAADSINAGRFDGPSSFGPGYVDSPAHGAAGARGGFSSPVGSRGDQSSDYGSGASGRGSSFGTGNSYGGYNDGSDYTSPGSYGGSYGGSSKSGGAGSYSGKSSSGPASKDAGEHTGGKTGSGGYGSGTFV